MQSLKHMLQRSIYLSTAIIFALLMLALSIGPAMQRAGAAQFQDRNITLASSNPNTVTTGTAGQGINGNQTRHTFTFEAATTSTLISTIMFRYCTTPFGTCTAPTGLNVDSAAKFGTFTGLDNANWTVDATATTASTIAIEHTGDDTVNSGTQVTTAFGDTGGWIVNPTNNGTYFVRISSYTGTDWSTGLVDDGNVAFSINTDIDITAIVQETLEFSTTAATPLAAEGASCDLLTGSGAIALGDANNVLSIAQAYDDYSYYRLSTNSTDGTTVQYTGNTLVSGSNNIDAIGGTATASAVGSEQFGLGVDTNGDGEDGTAAQAQLNNYDADYDGGDGTITNGGTATFAFETSSLATPVTIVSSTNIVDCDTAAVRYIANISPLTPAGIYTTSIGYIATPTY